MHAGMRVHLEGHQGIAVDRFGQEVGIHGVFVGAQALEHGGRLGQYRDVFSQELPRPGGQARPGPGQPCGARRRARSRRTTLLFSLPALTPLPATIPRPDFSGAFDIGLTFGRKSSAAPMVLGSTESTHFSIGDLSGGIKLKAGAPQVAFDLKDAGKLGLTGTASFTATRVTDVHIPDTLVTRFAAAPDQLRTFYFGRQAENRLEDSVPHQRGSLTARYTLQKLNAQARASYYGKAYFKPDLADNDEEFGAKVLLDAEVGYQLTKNLMLAVGGTNLLNTFPDKLQKEANTSFGRFVYTRNVSQFDQNGAFYYAKAELTFF
jgi:hypothetical protein